MESDEREVIGGSHQTHSRSLSLLHLVHRLCQQKPQRIWEQKGIYNLSLTHSGAMGTVVCDVDFD